MKIIIPIFNRDFQAASYIVSSWIYKVIFIFQEPESTLPQNGSASTATTADLPPSGHLVSSFTTWSVETYLSRRTRTSRQQKSTSIAPCPRSARPSSRPCCHRVQLIVLRLRTSWSTHGFLKTISSHVFAAWRRDTFGRRRSAHHRTRTVAVLLRACGHDSSWPHRLVWPSCICWMSGIVNLRKSYPIKIPWIRDLFSLPARSLLWLFHSLKIEDSELILSKLSKIVPSLRRTGFEDLWTHY